MDTTPNDAGMELYNENGVKIVGKTVDEGSFWGTAVLLYCENTSGKNVGISVLSASRFSRCNLERIVKAEPYAWCRSKTPPGL